jgi:hypothetical protein
VGIEIVERGLVFSNYAEDATAKLECWRLFPPPLFSPAVEMPAKNHKALRKVMLNM